MAVAAVVVLMVAQMVVLMVVSVMFGKSVVARYLGVYVDTLVGKLFQNYSCLPPSTTTITKSKRNILRL